MGTVTFIREKKTLTVLDGTTILEAEIAAGLGPDAPCGGQGKCGKCLVRADGEIVKACREKVWGDVEVDTLPDDSGHRILTKGVTRPVAFDPSLRKKAVRLEKAEPGDNRSDWERLCVQLGGSFVPSLEIASAIYACRREQEEWIAVYAGSEVLELKKTEPALYMAAFDIGTTTVVGYLLNACTGQAEAVESRLNPQAQFGADVIMRANYALEHGTEVLSDCIRKAVDELLLKLAEKAGIEREDIYQVCVVGNTAMHHLFLGIHPGSLVHSPYNPALSQRLTLKAKDYGLHIHRKAQLLMLPDIAGYVGADTCGCLLALRQDLKKELTLMIDIGTNGELVLGNREKMAACSTAAGPAFEGAKIECGMRGASGAVDHVFYENGTWSWTTVDNAPAVGLCGSGLIDLVARLYENELIDETGHLESGQENDSVFVLVPPKLAGNERGVYLTQKDVREVQLAKAAIAAGIILLCRELNVKKTDIEKIYIAGAFGNYMNPESACAIGLLPSELKNVVEPVGNAAGEGAKIALLNEEELKKTDLLVKGIRFVELAASPDFQDCFVDELEFPY